MQSDTYTLILSDTTSDQSSAFFYSGQDSKFTWQDLHTCEVSFFEIVPPISDAFLTMLASEEILRRDWDTPEEDAAWADL